MSISIEQADRIKKYHLERISKIRKGDIPVIFDTKRLDGENTPLRLKSGPTIVYHITPINISNSVTTLYDLSGPYDDRHQLAPIGDSFHSFNYNSDGLITYRLLGIDVESYLQIFHSGSVEAVDTSEVGESKEFGFVMSGRKLQEDIKRLTQRCFTILTTLRVEPPCFIKLSLLKASKVKVVSSRPKESISISELLIPEIFAPSFDIDLKELMNPIFNVLWNASGWARDPAT